MGYNISAYGTAVFRKNVNKKEIEKQLKSLHNEIEYDVSDTEVYFWENGNYNENDTIEFLNTLIPYISNGNVKYTGEEGEMWRFILVNGEWEEQSARVFYTTEDIIKALEAEGYTVTRGIY